MRVGQGEQRKGQASPPARRNRARKTFKRQVLQCEYTEKSSMAVNVPLPDPFEITMAGRQGELVEGSNQDLPARNPNGLAQGLRGIVYKFERVDQCNRVK